MANLKNKKFFKVGEVLPKIIRRLGIKKEAEASFILGLWPEIASEILGKNISSKTKAVRFKNNTLLVEVENSVIGTECFQSSHQLIKKFDQKLNGNKIQKIQFRIRHQA